MKKVKKVPAKNIKFIGKIKCRFEVSPSKYPKKYKDLWLEDDKLLEQFTTGCIAIAPSSGLDCFNSAFSALYSTSYLWLEYSSFLHYVYEKRSSKCYCIVDGLSCYSDVNTNYIEILFNNMRNYYIDDLGISPKNINNDTLYLTCSWFLFHVSRSKNHNMIGMKISYDRHFYCDAQRKVAKVNKISGYMVQKILDYFVSIGLIFMYKGYKLKDSVSRTTDGDILYSGETKSAMTLCIFTKELLDLYTKQVDNITNYKKFYPKHESSDFSEVRRKSKSKEIIPKEEYPMEWLDTIAETECVMEQYDNILSNSVITIGGFEILEKFFRRIWIGDLYTYGRVHDNGGFQTKTKQMRKSILIDGLPTVTIDLSSLHPRLLYAKENIELPYDFDPYPALDIKLDIKRINKFKKFYNIEEYNPTRSFTKVALLILINADSIVSARCALEGKLKSDAKKGGSRREKEMKFIGIPCDIDCGWVLNSIMEHNSDIAKYFASGKSKELMNKDSNIIMDVLATLTSQGIVSLPLHDSITVNTHFFNEGVSALEHGYTKAVGSLINFKYGIE